MKNTGLIQLLRLCFVGLVILCPESCNKEDISDDIETGSEGIIAFTSGRDGNNEIYVMNADGSEETRLTENSAIDMSPDWSPDGQRLAFVSNRNGNNDDEVAIVQISTGNITRLTTSAGWDSTPAWK